jgi:hypothetical protein
MQQGSDNNFTTRFNVSGFIAKIGFMDVGFNVVTGGYAICSTLHTENMMIQSYVPVRDDTRLNTRRTGTCTCRQFYIKDYY